MRSILTKIAGLDSLCVFRPDYRTAAIANTVGQLEEYYKISYLVVSLLFISPVAGYITSAALNNLIHMRMGQRGIAILGPGAHLIAYIVIAVHPPYPVLVLACVLSGFGNGLSDAAW